MQSFVVLILSIQTEFNLYFYKDVVKIRGKGFVEEVNFLSQIASIVVVIFNMCLVEFAYSSSLVCLNIRNV